MVQKFTYVKKYSNENPGDLKKVRTEAIFPKSSKVRTN